MINCWELCDYLIVAKIVFLSILVIMPYTTNVVKEDVIFKCIDLVDKRFKRGCLCRASCDLKQLIVTTLQY